jgi:hypothetical protein
MNEVFHESLRITPRLLLLCTALFSAGLARLQLSWRSLEPSAWWASNGRDVLIAFSLAALTLSLHGVGYALPVALLWSAQLTSAEVLVEALLLRVPGLRWPDAWALLASLVLASPLAWAPRACALAGNTVLLVLSR